MKTFRLNNKNYKTDNKTMKVLKSIMSSAKKNNDSTAVQAMIFLGLKTGKIVLDKN